LPELTLFCFDSSMTVIKPFESKKEKICYF